MDTLNIANLASRQAQNQLSQVVGVTMLRKALDLQADSAMQLISALPQVPNLPTNLGKNINTTA